MQTLQPALCPSEIPLPLGFWRVPTEADAPTYRSQVGLHSIRMPMAAINPMVARQGSNGHATILRATDRTVLADAVRSATL